jgi:hypothetical protein
MSQNVATGKKFPLALALATGVSTAAAAEQIGVSRRTVERQLAKPAFRRLVAKLRARMIAAALGRVAKNMTRAADALSAMIDVEDPSLRLRAIRTVLSFGLQMQGTVDVNDRIADVEDELARKQGVQP